MYEFKENDLVAGSFYFRAEDIVAECFKETKPGRGIPAVSDKVLKTRNNARIPENTKKSTSWSVRLICKDSSVSMQGAYVLICKDK